MVCPVQGCLVRVSFPNYIFLPTRHAQTKSMVYTTLEIQVRRLRGDVQPQVGRMRVDGQSLTPTRPPPDSVTGAWQGGGFRLGHVPMSSRSNSFANRFSSLRNVDPCSFSPPWSVQIPQPVERDMERDRMTRTGRPAGSHSNRQPTVATTLSKRRVNPFFIQHLSPWFIQSCKTQHTGMTKFKNVGECQNITRFFSPIF